MSDRNILVSTLVGSRLYGLENAESDTDHASIYLPTLNELLLGSFPQLIDESTTTAVAKNTKNDKDLYIYALPYFINLAVFGKQQLIDMLHARPETTIHTSPIWEELKRHRRMFYSKNMSSSVDFLAKQVMRYGDRVQAIEEMEKVRDLIISLLQNKGNVKIREIAHLLPVSKYCYFVTTENRINTEVNWVDHNEKQRGVFYRIDGALIEVSLTLAGLLGCVEGRLQSRNYATKLLIKENKGKTINWSEITHALRVGYQVKAILIEGDFEYPLPETEFLLKVKAGDLDFIKDVQPYAEELVSDLKRLLFTSTLPDNVDVEYWNKWLLDTYHRFYYL